MTSPVMAPSPVWPRSGVAKGDLLFVCLFPFVYKWKGKIVHRRKALGVHRPGIECLLCCPDSNRHHWLNTSYLSDNSWKFHLTFTMSLQCKCCYSHSVDGRDPIGAARESHFVKSSSQHDLGYKLVLFASWFLSNCTNVYII